MASLCSRVVISAEVKSEREVKEGDKVLRSERQLGRVSRTFVLPQDVDEDKAQAEYNNGVLKPLLAKRTTAKTRGITIQ